MADVRTVLIPGPGWTGTAWPTAAPREDAGLGAALAFLAGLVILILYSQSYAAPITGYQPAPFRASLIRNLMLPAYVAGLFLMAASWRKALSAVLPNFLLVALLGLAFLTVTWSIDPAASFRRAIALTFTTLAGFTLAARFGWRRLAELIACAYAINAVVSFLLGFGVPAYGRMQEIFPGAWRGLWLEKNALGGMMAAGALFGLAAAIYARPRRLLWLAVAALCVLLVVLSQSKTSLMALVVGLGVMAMIWVVRLGPLMAVAGIWLAVAGTAALAAVFVAAPDLIFKALGKDATFTGRTAIWAGAWRQLQEGRLWTGFGYGGVVWDHATGWYPGAWIAKDAKFTAGHAHNGWMETALSFGLPGLILWALYWLQAMGRGLASLFRGGGAYLALPFLAGFTLRSITEVSVLDQNDLEWALFVLFAVKLGMPEGREEDT